MVLLDGKSLAEKLIESVKEKAAVLMPKLVVIMVGEHPASQAYVRHKEKACAKAGIAFELLQFPDSIAQETLLNEVDKLNNDASVNGFIIQLPLPPHLEAPKIFRAIDPKKDVDGFTAYNIGKMTLSPDFEDLPPATPLGIIKLLDHYSIPVQGKEVVVVGHSNLVGKPVSIMLLNRNATVTTCHIYTQDLSAHTQKADILIVAVGKANLITADMVKEGAIVVDVGINQLPDGHLVGDVDFEGVSPKTSYITPVPGGVGPMTVAALILNTIRATERQKVTS